MLDHRARTLAVNDATYAAWNAHDPDAVAAVFAENAVAREVGGAGETHGRAAIRARAVALLTAFPPTGRTVRVEGATFSHLGPDGLVATDVHFSDVAGLMAQLGRTS